MRSPRDSSVGLAHDLRRRRVPHSGDRVQVLDLGARAERRAPRGLERHVRVAAQAPLFHVAVGDAEPAHEAAQRGEVGERVIGRRERRFGNHLGERNATAVEVEARLLAVAGLLGVRRLAGVLLEVDARERHGARVRGRPDVEEPAGHDRLVVLRNLIVLRHVRVEVVLAREDRALVHGRPEREPEARHGRHRARVQHGQRTGQAEAHRAYARVRLARELVRAGAEELALRAQLDVDLES